MRRAITITALLLLAAIPSLAADIHLGPETALGASVNAGASQVHVRLAQASAHLLAVWVSTQGLTGSLDGSRLDLPLGGSNPTIVGVAGGRTNFLVAYQVQLSDFSLPLLAVRVGFDGHLLDAAPIVVLTDTRGVWGGGVTYDGAEFVIATMIKAPGLSSVIHASDLITGRVADDGTVHAGTRLKPTQTSGTPSWPNIGTTGSRVVLGYTVQFFKDENLGPWGLSDLQLDPLQAADSTVGETVFPDVNSPGGLRSSMAVGPDRVTFAWMAINGGMTTIRAAQTDLNGTPVAGPRILAVPAPLPSIVDDGTVAVAWDGSEYLVAWVAPRPGALGRIQGLRLHADGSAIDPQPFDLSPDPVAADIALIAVPRGFAIAYSRADAANNGILRAFVRTLDRLPAPPRRHAAGR